MPRQTASSHLLEPIALTAPFWRYFEAFRRHRWPFLLDSASDPEKLGRFSFMGSDPSRVFRAKRLPAEPGRTRSARCTLLEANDIGDSCEGVETVGDPFVELRRLLAEHAIASDAYASRPVPLLAGAVGYFGFEANAFIEALPDTGRDDLDLPDIHLGFYDAMLVHCHRTGTSYVSVVGRGPDEPAARRAAVRKRDELVRRIGVFQATAPHERAAPLRRGGATASGLVTHAVTDAAYCALVERAKDHILAGDVFELCLTHRMQSPFDGDPWDLYCELRRINPAPFACFFDMPEATIVSSSPERFLKLDHGGFAESRPIKGTRPRGASATEDAALHAELEASTKDRAENTMIVDLVRSDFGRVCRFGSVHVPELCIIERYATLFQMVSTIRGQLLEGRDALDLLTACFPGGSMTGAPKIEALKILDALEPVKRSVYAGAIGYLDFSGTMDLAIVIRTILVKADTAFYNVGGAIVADSVPMAEYQETLDKARALMNALGVVSGPGNDA